MKHTKSICTIMICILCMFNHKEAKAQGLSLSFNLTETDTLANLIAESKKYDIESLTLSGHVNGINTKYIQDLNLNGKLIKLDLTNVELISPGIQQRQIDIYGYTKYETFSISNILKSYGCPAEKAAELAKNYPSHSTYYSVIIRIDDILYEDKTQRNFRLIYNPGAYFWGTVTNTETCDFPISVLCPKRIFDINTFKQLHLPMNLTSIGGADCSFRIKSCEEYILGNQVETIDENAFMGSHIGILRINSTINEIKASAFENATGNILAKPQFLLQAKYIGEGAFKNSSLLEESSNEITLQAVKIDKSAFQNAILPKNVILPYIEEIGDSAFRGTMIESFEIGNHKISISDGVFANCTNLLKFIGGTNVQAIGNGAFYGNKKLEIFNPSTDLTFIGKEAFFNTALVNFSIPNTTKTIGYKAFANSELKELDLGMFNGYRRDIIDGCDSLEIISVSDNNDNLKTESGVLFSKNRSRIISYPCAKKDAIYELGNSVTEISDSAFYAVNKLCALVIPESIEKIGKNAFANSSILDIKLLPSTTPNVTNNMSGLDQSLVRLYVHEKDYSTYYIANYWGDFKNIYVLEKAVSADNIINVEKAGTLPGYIGFGNLFKYNTLRLSGHLNSDDVRYLREMAGRDVRGNKTAGMLSDLDFSQASIVKGGDYYYIKNEYSSGKLTTSDNVIGESMFEGCNFKTLTISETTTQIGDKALYGCPLTSFRIPATTKEFNPNSFFGMNTLKELNVDESNNNYQTQNGVLFTKDGKTLLLYPYAKEGERYSTPEMTTCIGEQAFGGSNLKVVTTNEGLSEIETLAFDHLGSLETISLPSTLKQIGHRAFWGCNKLLDISCKAYNPPTLKYEYDSYYGQPYNNFSDKTYENAVLLVPEKNGGYKSRSGWKLFKNIIENDSWMTGIQIINNNANNNIIKRYDINGRVINNPTSGINIIKMSDGTVKKIVKK